MRTLKEIGNMVVDIIYWVGIMVILALVVGVKSPTPTVKIDNTDYNSGSDYLQTVSGVNIYQDTVNPQL